MSHQVNSESVSIQSMVSQAETGLAPVWPIATFIACNPLQGFQSLPFEEALTKGACMYGASDSQPQVDAVNREMIKWCGAFLDLGQGTIDMPQREKGFYGGFRQLSTYDKRLHQGRVEHKAWLSSLPEQADEAISLCLEKLGIGHDDQHAFITQSLRYLPGWAGYVKWRSVWRTPTAAVDKTPVTLLDFIAVRLVITTLLWPEAGHEKKNNSLAPPQPLEVLSTIQARETSYCEQLLTQLLSKRASSAATTKRVPGAQLVFCIDVRSEPFRYCLEKMGDYETLGFAGFFGLPVRIHDYNSGHAIDSCPVLLKPCHDVHDRPVPGSFSCVAQHQHGKKILTAIKKVYQDLKYNVSTPFSLVETLGLWCGMTMLARTLAPVLTAKWLHALSEKMMPTVSTELVLSGMSLQDQVLYAQGALRTMGLTSHFAKLVVFCGHGSTTQNNPYASALDCGACGGNHGGGNAKLLAAILNTAAVRVELASCGLCIPADTLFKAALHNTTTDELLIYSDETRDESHRHIVKNLQRHALEAQMMNARKRCKAMGLVDDINPTEATRLRSHDWSEVRPEWGLARNAAFIVAPRYFTKSIDLDSRCFLHSYDWSSDEQGTALEAILTAPMVVAQWINSQYLFSTLDNVAYGSGSKVTHNVTSKLGIMQGNGSDLMHGLPLQSVMGSDDEAYHEPQRLLTIVLSPKKMISQIVKKNDVLNSTL